MGRWGTLTSQRGTSDRRLIHAAVVRGTLTIRLKVELSTQRKSLLTITNSLDDVVFGVIVFGREEVVQRGDMPQFQ